MDIHTSSCPSSSSTRRCSAASASSRACISSACACASCRRSSSHACTHITGPGRQGAHAQWSMWGHRRAAWQLHAMLLPLCLTPGTAAAHIAPPARPAPAPAGMCSAMPPRSSCAAASEGGQGADTCGGHSLQSSLQVSQPPCLLHSQCGWAGGGDCTASRDAHATAATHPAASPAQPRRWPPKSSGAPSRLQGHNGEADAMWAGLCSVCTGFHAEMQASLGTQA